MSIAMPSAGCLGPCRPNASAVDLARLIREEIDGVAGVVPQQMIGPAAGLALRIHIVAAEEIGLHVHLLDSSSPATILLWTYWWLGLKRRYMPGHRDEPGFPAASWTSASLSTRLSAIGISTRTCLPAFRQAIA